MLFNHIRDDVTLEEINLDEDFYWDIDADKLYDMQSKPIEIKPIEIDVGQLHNNWEFLSRIDNKEIELIDNFKKTSSIKKINDA